MALVRDLSKAQLAFQVADGEVDQFLVVRYRGTEGLCQLYRFEIELVTDAETIEFDSIVGKPAVLSINADMGTKWFHGIVAELEQTGVANDRGKYRAILVPSVWYLTHRHNSRIFQERTLKDIITEVLVAGGIASDRIDLSGMTGGSTPIENCVQYRETDYNFIARLMEESGVWWYFKQTQDGHVFTAADSKDKYEDIEGESASVGYVDPANMLAQEEHVFGFRLGQSVRPGKTVLTDFDFKNPPLDLQSLSDAGRDEGLEFFDYPGEYNAQAVGGVLAKYRAEEFEASRTRGIGECNSIRFELGRKFELTDHPAGLDDTYLFTRLTHQGRQSVTGTAGTTNGRAKMFSTAAFQDLVAASRNENRTIAGIAAATLDLAGRLSPTDRTARRTMTDWLYHAGQVCREVSATSEALGGNPMDPLSIPNLIEDVSRSELLDLDLPVYTCGFECIPAELEYRPPRVTPWPVMRGCQTARVVGPSGEEIHCDEYGRVRVQFHWDREGGHEENASCWIRVSQGFAGGNYGIMFLPRIGQEVIVDFLEGNPDQPIIVGRVYNNDHMPPYELPKEKSKSVIKTRSTKGGGGSNEIRFEDLAGEEQILLYGQKDIHIRAKNDRVENIEANRHLTVGNDRFEKVKKNYHLEVEEENRNVKIGGDDSLEVEGKVSVKVTGTQSTDVTGDVVDKFGMNHKHEVTQTYALKALSAKIEATTAIELKCGGSSIVLTPAAIFIVGGPLVNINTGAGPPVPPVTAQATTPEAPESPAAADEVEHGKDTTYSGGEELAPMESQEETPGHEFEEEEAEEQQEKTGWIRIRLVDEEGNPIPSERYLIITPDGKEIKGTLDANGEAHHGNLVEGECKISFPDLDEATVEQES